ncbi:MAG TPA: hypothetical protein VMB47_04395 [Candidatus Aquilonibacter sp.]|nr:hypothetical protein [Candidatus Aquilonibacter sp.]
MPRFCRERNFRDLLLRIEKPGQRWIRRRGGYTIPLAGVHTAVESLAREGILAQLLEPVSPYMDFYSLASVGELATGKIDVEVVGPGFDASDILRGDVTPHERFEIFGGTEPNRFGKYSGRQMRQSLLIDGKAYQASARRRLAKVGARLRNAPFPEIELRTSEGAADSEQLVKEGVKYLERSGQTLLLDHLKEYEPIPQSLLEEFLDHVTRLFRAAIEANVTWKALSAAGSFLGPESRLVMWDFFPPGNHETTFLSAMKAPSS